eukprot:GABV01011728.1.p2 GENE.GABV01011728.1~~GABV01011728.1.p2  ORF type:complete len:108 (-),score=21.59 GABV01011728.1:11-334(-)
MLSHPRQFCRNFFESRTKLSALTRHNSTTDVNTLKTTPFASSTLEASLKISSNGAKNVFGIHRRLCGRRFLCHDKLRFNIAHSRKRRSCLSQQSLSHRINQFWLKFY